MNAALVFTDRGWEVVTQAWTVAAKRHKKIRVCYAWSTGGYSLVAGATGISAVDLPMTMPQFLALLEKGGSVIDLRPYQQTD